MKDAKTAHPSRLSEIFGVLRRSDVVHGLDPRKLRTVLEELGPTFIKLGQILSMRADLIPRKYCDELKNLRTEVTPMPFDEVTCLLREEYGEMYDEIFAEIDPVALGSASIAQVHKAVLCDGEIVAVKVQRSGIYETMSRDITLIRRAISMLKVVTGEGAPDDLRTIIDEMWVAAQQEMDFIVEADHIERFARENKGIVYTACPQVHRALTTRHVLVMEYVDGIPVDNLSMLTQQGYDLAEIGEKLAESYAQQVLESGFFHADPHPGNLVVRGGQIVWLDLGMMGELSGRDRQLFGQLVSAFVAGDVCALKDVSLSLGIRRGEIDHAALYSDIDLFVAKYGSAEFAALDLGEVLRDLTDVLNRYHIGLSPGLSMLARGVLTIEGVLSRTSPSINFIRIFSGHLAGEALRRADWGKELRDAGVHAAHVLKKAVDIPSYLADVLKMTVKGQTKVNLELTGSEQPLRRIDRMVDKLILAIITTGLLVGSSLICTTDMKGKLFGIPALGAVGYLLAVVLGLRLLYDIYRKR